MKNYILPALIFFSFSYSVAQTNKKRITENKYTFIAQGGLLEGSADKPYGQFQILNGIQQKTWFYGLGLGIDYYGSKRSIPFFLDIRRDLLPGSRTPFVYADAGYNFSWLRDEDKMGSWGNDYKQSGGTFYEAGLGYKATLKNKMAIGISTGYSYKQQRESFTRLFFNILPFPHDGTAQQPEEYEYKFRRISVKINWTF